MELGHRLRQARLESGLSQRQLCGDVITRNMLSQIENGSARPSMDTLRYLAGALGKPVSYFLEEEAALLTPAQTAVARGRVAYGRGDYVEARQALEAVNQKEADPEGALILALSCMALAEQALNEGRQPYALTLLEQAGEAGAGTFYYTPELEKRRLLLLWKAKPGDAIAIAGRLPGSEEELLLRAKAALDMGLPLRAAALLEAAENRLSPEWNLLRGEVLLEQKDYAGAEQCFRRAEERYPRLVYPKLEVCCRELEDYQGAYFYACKQR